MKIVIVLGNRLETTDIHPELKGRVNKGVEVFRRENADYMILSGGKTNPSVSISEAEVMKRHAIRKGVEPEKIILDEESRDTIENAYYTRKIVDEISDERKSLIVYVISSCYHMKRAKFDFEQIYGSECPPNFEYCFEAEEREKEGVLMERDKAFFRGIEPGDMKRIEEKL